MKKIYLSIVLIFLILANAALAAEGFTDTSDKNFSKDLSESSSLYLSDTTIFCAGNETKSYNFEIDDNSSSLVFENNARNLSVTLNANECINLNLKGYATNAGYREYYLRAYDSNDTEIDSKKYIEDVSCTDSNVVSFIFNISNPSSYGFDLVFYAKSESDHYLSTKQTIAASGFQIIKLEYPYDTLSEYGIDIKAKKTYEDFILYDIRWIKDNRVISSLRFEEDLNKDSQNRNLDQFTDAALDSVYWDKMKIYPKSISEAVVLDFDSSNNSNAHALFYAASFPTADYIVPERIDLGNISLDSSKTASIQICNNSPVRSPEVSFSVSNISSYHVNYSSLKIDPLLCKNIELLASPFEIGESNATLIYSALDKTFSTNLYSIGEASNIENGVFIKYRYRSNHPVDTALGFIYEDNATSEWINLSSIFNRENTADRSFSYGTDSPVSGTVIRSLSYETSITASLDIIKIIKNHQIESFHFYNYNSSSSNKISSYSNSSVSRIDSDSYQTLWSYHPIGVIEYNVPSKIKARVIIDDIESNSLNLNEVSISDFAFKNFQICYLRLLDYGEDLKASYEDYSFSHTSPQAWNSTVATPNSCETSSLLFYARNSGNFDQNLTADISNVLVDLNIKAQVNDVTEPSFIVQSSNDYLVSNVYLEDNTSEMNIGLAPNVGVKFEKNIRHFSLYFPSIRTLKAVKYKRDNHIYLLRANNEEIPSSIDGDFFDYDQSFTQYANYWKVYSGTNFYFIDEPESYPRVSSFELDFNSSIDSYDRKVLRIENTGDKDLIIETSIIEADSDSFFIKMPTNSDNTWAISPGSYLDINVFYNPREIGSHNAELVINTNSEKIPSINISLHAESSQAQSANAFTLLAFRATTQHRLRFVYDNENKSYSENIYFPSSTNLEWRIYKFSSPQEIYKVILDNSLTNDDLEIGAFKIISNSQVKLSWEGFILPSQIDDYPVEAIGVYSSSSTRRTISLYSSSSIMSIGANFEPRIAINNSFSPIISINASNCRIDQVCYVDFQVCNYGEVLLEKSSISLNKPNTSDYSGTVSLAGTSGHLDPVCTINELAFSPSEIGEYNATLEISTNDPIHPILKINIISEAEASSTENSIILLTTRTASLNADKFLLVNNDGLRLNAQFEIENGYSFAYDRTHRAIYLSSSEHIKRLTSKSLNYATYLKFVKLIRDSQVVYSQRFGSDYPFASDWPLYYTSAYLSSNDLYVNAGGAFSIGSLPSGRLSYLNQYNSTPHIDLGDIPKNSGKRIVLILKNLGDAPIRITNLDHPDWMRIYGSASLDVDQNSLREYVFELIKPETGEFSGNLTIEVENYVSEDFPLIGDYPYENYKISFSGRIIDSNATNSAYIAPVRSEDIISGYAILVNGEKSEFTCSSNPCLKAFSNPVKKIGLDSIDYLAGISITNNNNVVYSSLASESLEETEDFKIINAYSYSCSIFSNDREYCYKRRDTSQPMIFGYDKTGEISVNGTVESGQFTVSLNSVPINKIVSFSLKVCNYGDSDFNINYVDFDANETSFYHLVADRRESSYIGEYTHFLENECKNVPFLFSADNIGNIDTYLNFHITGKPETFKVRILAEGAESTSQNSLMVFSNAGQLTDLYSNSRVYYSDNSSEEIEGSIYEFDSLAAITINANKKVDRHVLDFIPSSYIYVGKVKKIEEGKTVYSSRQYPGSISISNQAYFEINNFPIASSNGAYADSYGHKALKNWRTSHYGGKISFGGKFIPYITVEPKALFFEETEVGSYLDKILRICNIGDGWVKIEPAIEGGSSAEFDLTAFNQVFDPGSCYDVTVRYAPQSEGDKQATLSLHIIANSEASEVLSSQEYINIQLSYSSKGVASFYLPHDYGDASTTKSFQLKDVSNISKIVLEDCHPSFYLLSECSELSMTDLCSKDSREGLECAGASSSRRYGCIGSINPSNAVNARVFFDSCFCEGEGLVSCIMRAYNKNNEIVYEKRMLGQCKGPDWLNNEPENKDGDSFDVPAAVYTSNLNTFEIPYTCKGECEPRVSEDPNIELIKTTCKEKIKDASCSFVYKVVEERPDYVEAVGPDKIKKVQILEKPENIFKKSFYGYVPSSKKENALQLNENYQIKSTPSIVAYSNSSIKYARLYAPLGSDIKINEIDVTGLGASISNEIKGDISNSYAEAAIDINCPNEVCISYINFKGEKEGEYFESSVPVLSGTGLADIKPIIVGIDQSPKLAFSDSGLARIRIKNTYDDTITITGIKNLLPRGASIVWTDLLGEIAPQEEREIIIANIEPDYKFGSLILYGCLRPNSDCEKKYVQKLNKIVVSENAPDVCSPKLKEDKAEVLSKKPLISISKIENKIDEIPMNEFEAFHGRDLTQVDITSLIKKDDKTEHGGLVILLTDGDLKSICE